MRPRTTVVPSKARFSPCRACEHACKYCDGRAEKYYVEGDFERDVVVRRNLPDLLKHELERLREPMYWAHRQDSLTVDGLNQEHR